MYFVVVDQLGLSLVQEFKFMNTIPQRPIGVRLPYLLIYISDEGKFAGLESLLKGYNFLFHKNFSISMLTDISLKI